MVLVRKRRCGQRETMFCTNFHLLGSYCRTRAAAGLALDAVGLPQRLSKRRAERKPSPRAAPKDRSEFGQSEDSQNCAVPFVKLSRFQLTKTPSGIEF